ncbi:InlB B-repeat-containing protein [Bacillus sp. ISL-7]|uniref:InlB B-repeat-containing protein n=1 Tax=Bacillus sp. ISL-7 TaxID=2819136 RepID=UPI001BE7B48E|nr:InlB B-repeat-containing protein [Bacillus sp. ISL-7]MBT2738110.1 InlB B-repeat-containing protein [Bacillus sp. ISL-7]
MMIVLMMGMAPSTFSPIALAVDHPADQQTEVPSGYIGIYSAEDLYNVRNNLNGSYILMNDIDLTVDTAEGGRFFNNGSGWNPIGNAATPFTGNFDGNGFKIIGLKVTIQSSEFIYAGLFGYAKNAKITNVGMENNNIDVENTSLDSSTAKAYAGGVVGYGYNVTLTNIYNSGQISAQSLFEGYAGGIAGYVDSSYNLYSTVSNSNNTGAVNAKTAAGGIVGKTYRANINTVYNKGDFNTQSSGGYTGGIVGYLNTNSSITTAYNIGNIQYRTVGGGIAGYTYGSSINKSYNQGEISSTVTSSRGGGIVGTTSSTMISESYNTGKISGLGKYSDGGGIAGNLASNSSIVDSYNTADISADSSTGGIVGEQYSSVISKSFNTGTISGSYTGGMSGWSSGGTILDSFNIGSVKGKYDIGGITGYGSNTTIKNTYNAGSVMTTISYSGASLGGITGKFEGSMENSYYLDKVQNGVGTGVSEGTFKKTFEQMKDPSTFFGFNFSITWKLDEVSSFHFPILSQAPSVQTEKSLDLSMSPIPEKTAYVQGEELDLTGAKIKVRTNHGNEFVVAVSEDMVTGYNPNKIGNQTIKVNYDGLSTYFNLSVKAKYTVTFTDYDGRILKTEDVLEGESATSPETPSRAGYTFTGWSANYQQVKSNLTITAQYTINVYTVTYMDGDTVLNSEGYNSDAMVGYPVTPIKSGYTFIYWYQDPDFQTKYQFFQTLTENTTIYAKFGKNPDSPLNVKLSVAGFNKVKIAWSPVEGVDGYEVYRATSPNGDYNHSWGLGSNEQSLLWDDLDTGTTYYFKVRTYRIVDDQYIYSSFSPVLSSRPVLAGVTSVKAVSAGYDKVKLSWTKSGESSGYEIFRSVTSNGAYSQVGTVTSGSTLSYTNGSLLTGKIYYYKVRAYRTVDGKKVYSSFSSIVNAKPLITATTSVKAVTAGYNKTKVNWAMVSGANGYEVYRATSKTGAYSNIKTITSGSTLSYLNSSLTSGKTYYYKVRAYRTINGTKVYSPFSSIVSAKPTLAQPAKINVAKMSSTSIKVSWSYVSEASGYELYRATAKTGSYGMIKTQTTRTAVSFTNTKLAKGRTYFYKVRAYRMVNGKKIYSSFTTIMSAKL